MTPTTHDRNSAAHADVAGPSVPVWLAALVILLVVLVIGLGGLLLRVQADSPVTIVAGAPKIPLSAGITERLEKGFELRQRGDSKAAMAVYRDVVDRDPENLIAHYQLGMLLLERGDKATAEQRFLEVLKIDPTHAPAAKALAQLYRQRQDWSAMRATIQPAAAANPTLADVQYLLGVACERTGDRDGARAAYEAALQYDVEMAPARKALERLRGASSRSVRTRGRAS